MAVSLVNLYAQEGGGGYRWLKGNLHTHTTRSDGTREPQVVIDLYKGLGHDFLAFTDHDVFADFRGLDGRGMILIPGNEVSVFGTHLLQVGGKKRAEPLEDRHAVINEINKDGGFVVVNHPNWEADWNHCPYPRLEKWQGYVGLEIYNGVCLDLEGGYLAVDKWERLLSAGRMVWGFANDDSHRAMHEGRGWNVVLVKEGEADAAGVMKALKGGHFYASTGVQFEVIEVKGTELHVVGENVQEYEVFGEKAVRLARVKGKELRFEAGEVNSFYIRVQAYGEGSAMGWLQPFVVKGGKADGRRAMEEKFGAMDAPKPVLKALRVERMGELGSQEMAGLFGKAEVSNVFYDRSNGAQAAVRTAVRAVVGGGKLAFRIECDEPEMGKLKAVTTTDGNGNLWKEDSVEVLLDVEGRRERYWQLMVNPLGAFYGVHGAGWAKGLKYKTRAERGEKGWAVELMVDLATLAPGIEVGAGTRFGMHMSRGRAGAKGGTYMWAWVGSSNHTPSRFGWLEM